MQFFNKLVNWYFNKKSLPYWCIFIFDCAIVFFSYLAIFKVMNGGARTLGVLWQVSLLNLALTVFYAIGFKLFHTYDGILRYSSFVDLQRVGYATVFGAVLSYIAHFFLLQIPYLSVAYIGGGSIMFASLLAMLLLWAVRVLVKTVYDVSLDSLNARQAYVYGVTEGGMGLAKQVRNDKTLNLRLMGFVSEKPKLVNRMLMGLKVWPSDEHLVKHMKSNKIDALLVAQGAKDAFRQNKTLQDELIAAGIHIYMQSKREEWNPEQTGETENGVAATPLKEVSIEDLLPRDEISIDLKSVAKTLRGKCVMVTGSAGSIGSEIVRQICTFQPSHMVLVDSAETPQHDIRLFMQKNYPHIKAETIVTTICNKGRMETLFKTYKPDYVFHAAAYKHVPMMEDNPCEAIQNNVEGTRNIADLSVKYGVKKFVMISTDKAVNPTNVMGCSKRICEIYVQSLDKAIKDGKTEGVTQFVTTRFGNVLGSNGSVIPLFKEQIRNGGPVTVTHPDIFRYFMLIPEACKLVLEAGTMGHGGEIFVFDMGAPVKIVDLAKRMIKLSGAENIEIKYTGLRDGEKLYEEVLNDQEINKPTQNDKIKIATVREYDFAEVCNNIERLIANSYKYDDMETVANMKEIVPEYKSNHSVYEILDKK